MAPQTALLFLCLNWASRGGAQDAVPSSFHMLGAAKSESPAMNMAQNPFQTRTNRLTMPNTTNGKTLPVYVGFFIESIGNIKETEMAYHLDIYLYQNWLDPRLAHNGSMRVVSDQNSLNHIWVPDLYFANAKAAYFQTVTVPNFVMYISQDGTVAYSARITMTLTCNLDLQEYPLDSQVCMVKIMSYGRTRKEMDVRWFSRQPLNYDNAINLPEFYITDLTAEFCNGTYKYAITERAGTRTGEFSCLHAKIHLTRALGYHLVQTYIPTGMIVVISWVSFWIDPMAVPARVSLSFTTLLTLATQGAGLRYTLPPVSYAKAIDYWFGTCMLFLFAALLEFAVVNTLMRKAKKFQEIASQGHVTHPKNGAVGGGANPTAAIGDVMEYLLLHKETVSNHYAKRAVAIDRSCRLFFPGTFITFLVCYWLYYKVYSGV